jgi:hypothetical protein
MKAALLSLAILGAQLTTSAADSLPKIGSEKLCKARAAEDRMRKFAELQSVDDCVREQNDARERLGPAWSATERAVRTRCKAQSIALGMLSYVDLLICIQMVEDLKSPSPGSNSADPPSPGK